MNKQEQRIMYKEIRKSLPNKKEKSEVIVSKILNLEEYKKSRVVALYSPLHSEVSIQDLIYDVLEHDKIVVMPKITSPRDMKFIQINSIQDLDEVGSLNIIEPKEGKEFSADEIDFMVVPGIAFDHRGYRIGYGKGFYDIFLSNSKNHAFKVGACFRECYMEENIDTNDGDVRVDLVITD